MIDESILNWLRAKKQTNEDDIMMTKIIREILLLQEEVNSAKKDVLKEFGNCTQDNIYEKWLELCEKYN